jgi:biotin operon repressor
MRKDVREFIRRLEAVGLTVEPTPGHYRVLRDGKPLRKASAMPFTLPFSPDTIRWRRAAIIELRKLGIDVEQGVRNAEARRPFGHRASTATRSHPHPHM